MEWMCTQTFMYWKRRLSAAFLNRHCVEAAFSKLPFEKEFCVNRSNQRLTLMSHSRLYTGWAIEGYTRTSSEQEVWYYHLSQIFWKVTTAHVVAALLSKGGGSWDHFSKERLIYIGARGHSLFAFLLFWADALAVPPEVSPLGALSQGQSASSWILGHFHWLLQLFGMDCQQK